MMFPRVSLLCWSLVFLPLLEATLEIDIDIHYGSYHNGPLLAQQLDRAWQRYQLSLHPSDPQATFTRPIHEVFSEFHPPIHVKCEPFDPAGLRITLAQVDEMVTDLVVRLRSLHHIVNSVKWTVNLPQHPGSQFVVASGIIVGNPEVYVERLNYGPSTGVYSVAEYIPAIMEALGSIGHKYARLDRFPERWSHHYVPQNPGAGPPLTVFVTPRTYRGQAGPSAQNLLVMNAISALRQVVQALEHDASPGSSATSRWRGNHIQFQILQRRQDARSRGPGGWVIVADARVEVTPHRISLSEEEVGAGANGTMVVPLVGSSNESIIVK